MIWSKLQEIKTAVINTGIFPTGNVFMGEEFQIGADNTPFCVIKSGSGDLSGRRVDAVAHVMALFNDSNIEQTVNDNLKIIARNLDNIDNVNAAFFTTDDDIFAPFGLTINPVPPFGGFRLEIQILGQF